MNIPTPAQLLAAAEVLEMCAIDFRGRPALQNVAAMLRLLSESSDPDLFAGSEKDLALTENVLRGHVNDYPRSLTSDAIRRAISRIAQLPALERRCEELEANIEDLENKCGPDGSGLDQAIDMLADAHGDLEELHSRHARTVQAARKVSRKLRDLEAKCGRGGSGLDQAIDMLADADGESRRWEQAARAAGRRLRSKR